MMREYGFALDVITFATESLLRERKESGNHCHSRLILIRQREWAFEYSLLSSLFCLLSFLSFLLSFSVELYIDLTPLRSCTFLSLALRLVVRT